MTRSLVRTAALFFVALAVAGLTAAQRPSRPGRPPASKPSAGIKVVASEADPNALAVAAAPVLAKAAADWKAERSALPTAESGTGTPAYSSDEVAKLLAGVEAAVQKALGEPELKPLSDRTALVFRRARTALGNPGNVGQGQAEKATVDHALEPVGQFLDQLAALAGKGAVTTDLCVVSKPAPGARFSIRPASVSAAVKTLPATDGPITAVRGLYVYRLEPVPGSKGKAIQCGWDTGAGTASPEPCLDLFDDAKTPLVCDFAQGACQRAAGSCS
ncbi:MAG TPA: hypothetical protein VGR07_22870 [Thermoanaerobaculia bacterium]|jgi:hypothetical protein|nr:hypothetical protein [Thermoanaerobaculia bacterium]